MQAKSAICVTLLFNPNIIYCVLGLLREPPYLITAHAIRALLLNPEKKAGIPFFTVSSQFFPSLWSFIDAEDPYI